MLVFTRYEHEAFTIGDDISVTVLGIRGNQLRLGISAPKEVAVHRSEVYRRIQAEKEVPVAREEGQDRATFLRTEASLCA